MDQAGTELQEPQQMGEEHRRGLFVLRWLAWFGAFLVFYVLSIGPAAKVGAWLDLPRKYPRAARVVVAIYWPVDALAVNYMPAEQLLIWYLRDVWRVPPYHP